MSLFEVASDFHTKSGQIIDAGTIVEEKRGTEGEDGDDGDGDWIQVSILQRPQLVDDAEDGDTVVMGPLALDEPESLSIYRDFLEPASEEARRRVRAARTRRKLVREVIDTESSYVYSLAAATASYAAAIATACGGSTETSAQLVAKGIMGAEDVAAPATARQGDAAPAEAEPTPSQVAAAVKAAESDDEEEEGDAVDAGESDDDDEQEPPPPPPPEEEEEEGEAEKEEEQETAAADLAPPKPRSRSGSSRLSTRGRTRSRVASGVTGGDEVLRVDLDEATVSFITCALPEVLGVNRLVLEAVSDAAVGDGCIGAAFLSVLPYLRVYRPYCAQYQHAIQAIAARSANAKAPLARLLERVKAENAAAVAAGDSGRPATLLDLSSLLIMPVQRLPRYRMLFDELHEVTPDAHPDKQALFVCAARLSQLADDVNEFVRDRENLEQLLAVRRAFTPALPMSRVVAPRRKFLRFGEVDKLCRKGPKRRVLFLFSDEILYGAPSGDFAMVSSEYDAMGKASTVCTPAMLASRTLVKPTTLSLTGARVSTSVAPTVSGASALFGLQLESAAKSFILLYPTEAARDSWLTEFRTAIADHLRETGTAGGAEGGADTAATAPVWVPDFVVAACMLCEQPFTMLKRRHHCRKCGKLCCASCSAGRGVIEGSGSTAKVRLCSECMGTTSGNSSRSSVGGGGGGGASSRASVSLGAGSRKSLPRPPAPAKRPASGFVARALTMSFPKRTLLSPRTATQSAPPQPATKPSPPAASPPPSSSAPSSSRPSSAQLTFSLSEIDEIWGKKPTVAPPPVPEGINAFCLTKGG
jgi:hypothetical protein